MRDRLPWECVETLPHSDTDLLARWDGAVAAASDDATRAHALVGRALASYWAVQQEVISDDWDTLRERRRSDVAEAERLARRAADPDLLAECLLGRLYALWGPDCLGTRAPVIVELEALRPSVQDEELRLRVLEWRVLEHLDRGELAAAKDHIEAFARESAGTELVLLRRREELWRGNVAMLEGDVDGALQLNQDAISSTADTAGSPFSFQNVAVTLAIERFLRRGLDDVIEPIRSIRASSPRVAVNWDTALAFALSEVGQLEEAAAVFETVAADDFAPVRRDLNWLVVMHLLGLVALHLDDVPRVRQLLDHLRPFAELDATHGSGYASYGPVGRVVARLEERCGDAAAGAARLERVLASRPAGPWTSLARLDLADVLRQDEPVLALRHAEQAATELRAMELPEWAAVARSLVEELHLAGHGAPIARLDGAQWSLRHPSGAATVADSKGVRHLVALLSRPGEALDVTALDTHIDRSLPVAAAASATLDDQARAAYRRRLDELAGRRRALSDEESAEVEMLRRELAGARYVASGSVELERARVRVTKAIHRAVAAVRTQSPSLAAHLDAAVETGRRCTYAPPDGTAWRVLDP